MVLSLLILLCPMDVFGPCCGCNHGAEQSGASSSWQRQLQSIHTGGATPLQAASTAATAGGENALSSPVPRKIWSQSGFIKGFSAAGDGERSVSWPGLVITKCSGQTLVTSVVRGEWLDSTRRVGGRCGSGAQRARAACGEK